MSQILLNEINLCADFKHHRNVYILSTLRFFMFLKMIILILLLLKEIEVLLKILVFFETNGFSWFRCSCISFLMKIMLYGDKMLIIFCCFAVVAVDVVAISVALSKIKLKFFHCKTAAFAQLFWIAFLIAYALHYDYLNIILHYCCLICLWIYSLLVNLISELIPISQRLLTRNWWFICG